jgi:amylo-alpha-1,6-glucosidase
VTGNAHGIRVDSDGTLAAGEPGMQLTWIDAKVGDWVVTPRHGKPVEIQALRYNALRTMADLAQRLWHTADTVRYTQMADRPGSGFRDLFWNEAAGCLYDVVDGDRRDARIGPNQPFALSLVSSYRGSRARPEHRGDGGTPRTSPGNHLVTSGWRSSKPGLTISRILTEIKSFGPYGVVEGLNSKAKATMRRSYGFRRSGHWNSRSIIRLESCPNQNPLTNFSNVLLWKLMPPSTRNLEGLSQTPMSQSPHCERPQRSRRR